MVLQEVEAKEHEREWVGLQSFGDLDDNRLVDGATGDRNIFRRRADVPPDPRAPQQKPKRLRCVLRAVLFCILSDTAKKLRCA